MFHPSIQIDGPLDLFSFAPHRARAIFGFFARSVSYFRR